MNEQIRNGVQETHTLPSKKHNHENTKDNSEEALRALPSTIEADAKSTRRPEVILKRVEVMVIIIITFINQQTKPQQGKSQKSWK